MSVAPHSVLEAARRQAGMSFEDLWLAYFSLGGTARPAELQAYLDGSPAVPVEYDILAQAINECFLDQGGNHPVPYHDDLT